MKPLPREDDTPFSLPQDTPEVTPIDYPEFDSAADAHEAYDEGLDDTVDVEPYEFDDDSIKSTKRIMKSDYSEPESYTINQDIIRRWAEYRYGHPAHIKNGDNELANDGLVIHFEDNEPDVDIEAINWAKFFDIFEKYKLAFVYKTRNRNGSASHFYKFINRRDVERITEARKVSKP